MWMRLRSLMRFCETAHTVWLWFISFVWIAHRNYTEWVWNPFMCDIAHTNVTVIITVTPYEQYHWHPHNLFFITVAFTKKRNVWISLYICWHWAATKIKEILPNVKEPLMVKVESYEPFYCCRTVECCWRARDAGRERSGTSALPATRHVCHWGLLTRNVCVYVFLLIFFIKRRRYVWTRLYGLITLPDTDSDPDPGSDMHPRNGNSNDWGSAFILESESPPVQWE